jgi:hypothetical protein
VIPLSHFNALLGKRASKIAASHDVAARAHRLNLLLQVPPSDPIVANDETEPDYFSLNHGFPLNKPVPR